jgi:hypothetical protein
MSHQSGCVICGADLIYTLSQEPLSCAICGAEFEADARCQKGHYVCNTCHSGSANDWIANYCEHSPETDPVKLAITLMHSPTVKMHGPEHHFLVPAVLLTTYYNHQNTPEEKAPKMRTARIRAENVLGGFCGFYGACGAGVGTGIYASVLTGATPLSARDWKLSNLITAESLGEIAEHGGPRCCKRDTFLALQTAVDFTTRNFQVELPITPIECEFSDRNKECLECACPFYVG